MVERVMAAGRENGMRAIIFQQTVAQLLDLNATDMKCLDVIATQGPASPTQLAKLTGLSTGAVTVLIDRLENAKLIERKPDPSDRRRTLLIPTARARQKAAPLYCSMGKAIFELASKYSDQELELLEDFFNKMIEMWKKETVKLQNRD